MRLDVALADGTDVRVELSRDRFAALEPRIGETFFVAPRDLKVFRDPSEQPQPPRPRLVYIVVGYLIAIGQVCHVESVRFPRHRARDGSGTSHRPRGEVMRKDRRLGQDGAQAAA